MPFNPFDKSKSDDPFASLPAAPGSARAAKEDSLKMTIDIKREKKAVAPPEPVKPSKESAKMAILKQYGGLESNIPITSSYWRMKG